LNQKIVDATDVESASVLQANTFGQAVGAQSKDMIMKAPAKKPAAKAAAPAKAPAKAAAPAKKAAAPAKAAAAPAKKAAAKKK
jgi:hypothetical protein